MELTGSNKTRIPELDGIRGIAIAMILVYHYGNNLIDAGASVNHLRFAVLTHYFYTGVDLFFVLSGFLLGGILWRNRGSKNYFKTFYIRRFCRILPIYYVGLIAVFFICNAGIGKGTEWWFNDKVPYWSYALFIQNILMGINHSLGNRFLTNFWSLGLEEQFYLILPLLIYFFNKRSIIVFLIVCVLAAPFFRHHSKSYFEAFNFIFCRFDALFSGVLIAIAVENKTVLKLAEKYKNHLIVFLCACFVVTIALSIGAIKMHYHNISSWFAFLWCVLLFVSVTNRQSFFAIITRSKFLCWMGKYSYGIYIYHQIVIGLLFLLYRDTVPQMHTLADMWLVIISLVISLSVAWVSYHLLEKRMIKVGHKFQY